MANTPQAKKRIRRNTARTVVNTNRLSRIRTFIKKVEAAIEGGDKDVAASALKAAQPEMARGVARGVLPAGGAQGVELGDADDLAQGR